MRIGDLTGARTSERERVPFLPLIAHSPNRSEYRSASESTNRIFTGRPARALTSLPDFQVTARSTASPKTSLLSSKV